MSTDSVSSLRQRMIEDMNARKLCAGTQRGHIGPQLKATAREAVTALKKNKATAHRLFVLER